MSANTPTSSKNTDQEATSYDDPRDSLIRMLKANHDIKEKTKQHKKTTDGHMKLAADTQKLIGTFFRFVLDE